MDKRNEELMGKDNFHPLCYISYCCAVRFCLWTSVLWILNHTVSFSILLCIVILLSNFGGIWP